ncbi:MAG: peptidoglycan-binding protein [Chroococcales cyanobacterium]
MISHRLTPLVVALVTYLSIFPNYSRYAGLVLAQSTSASLTLAQLSTDLIGKPLLKPGDSGEAVEKLQTQLKQLGYLDAEVDGQYGETTRQAVLELQREKGLIVDGIVGASTWDSLEAALTESEPPATDETSSETAESPPENEGNAFLWILIGLAVAFSGIGGGLLFFLTRFNPVVEEEKSQALESENSQNQSLPGSSLTPLSPPESEKAVNQNHSTQKPKSSQRIGKTTRLAKLDIVEELIKDLQQSDPAKRRKAIWELAQRGDSRAIQPLVNLLVESNSQQRSLILEALSQIGIRTLTPMNRALAISLQDENAQVRKNAIRDVTRIYELISQLNQLLTHAANDSDLEVQETAQWAIKQLKRLQSSPVSWPTMRENPSLNPVEERNEGS